MGRYRIYDVASDGHFIGPARFLTADDDAEAVQQTSEHTPDVVWGAEIWNDDRLVALLALKYISRNATDKASSSTTQAILEPQSISGAEVFMAGHTSAGQDIILQSRTVSKARRR